MPPVLDPGSIPTAQGFSRPPNRRRVRATLAGSDEQWLGR